MWFNRDAFGANLVLEIDAITHGTPLNLDNLETNAQRRKTAAMKHQRSGGVRKPPDQTWRLILGKETEPKPPGDWITRGACRGRHDLFVYPVTNIISEREARHREQTAKAVAICVTCPVITECRSWALTMPDPAFDHIAGGLSPWERKRLRKQHLKALPHDT
jgi:WhiB family redox-sensing transcriptional regulator